MKDTIKNLDFWGTTTALLCAVHCAILPIILSLGLISSNNWMANPLFEVIALSLTVVFVFFSIIRPYFKNKSPKSALATALMGLLLVVGHHSVPSYGHIIVVIGGLLVATSHIINLRYHKHSY